MNVFEVDGTEPLGNGKYKIYVEMGRDSAGKRRRRTKTVTPTSERNLRKLKRDFEIQCHEERNEPLENITFSSFVDRWMKNHVNTQLKETSRKSYQQILDAYLLDYFGKMKMKEIKRFHIVEFLSLEEKMKANKIIALKSIFNKAHEWEIIEDNPAKHIKIPAPNKNKHSYYNEDELNHLFKVLDKVNPKHRIMIKLAAVGGLRRAEIAGIREECINFEENYIYVDKQLRYTKEKKFYLSSVKNKVPRKVYFPPEFMEELKTYITDIKRRRLAMGNAWKPLIIDDKPVNLIMIKENGFPTHVDTLTSEWGKIKRKYKLKDIRFHDLRHSCASLMVKKGINFKVIKERLGHSSITITLDLYSHLEDDQHIASTDAFSGIL